MKIRISLSVGGFNEKVCKTWGIEEWQGMDDLDQDVLFFGMYTLHDYDALWYHTGKKTIFWCGSDILNLTQVPEFQRRLRLYEIDHYTETSQEADLLASVKIKAKIVPSFLEDVNDFPITWKPSKTPHVFLSGHPNREEEYGFDLVKAIAPSLPEFTFHLYGVKGESTANVIYHGNVKNEQFNKDIQKYHCGLRPNEQDGFSEIPIKAILNGGYAITRKNLPHMEPYMSPEQLIDKLKKLKEFKEPNLEAREYWIAKLNDYPWVKKTT